MGWIETIYRDENKRVDIEPKEKTIFKIKCKNCGKICNYYWKEFIKDTNSERSSE